MAVAARRVFMVYLLVMLRVEHKRYII